MVNVVCRGAIALGIALLSAGSIGCGLDDGQAPPLAGPSEFGLSITMTATPDQVPRDGRAQSTVTLLVRDAQSRPVSGQRLTLGTSAGSLSQSEVVTDSAGRATVTFVAPPPGTVGNSAVISVLPVGTNFDNAFPRSFSIGLIGESNASAPTPSFTATPSAPVIMEPVTLDASATTDEGARCGDLCTYTWDFGGEATATGRVVTYRFQNVRTYAVRLTVTDRAGTSANLTQNVTVATGTAPSAVILSSPASPAQFEEVKFDATGSTAGPGRTITQYRWQFNDPNSSDNTTTGPLVTHRFNSLGTFTVTLTVTDSAGLTNTATATVQVTNGVTAAFNFSPTNPRVGDSVLFNAEESRGSDNGFGGRNPITRYIWNFGESESLEETSSPRITHQFSNNRTRTVTLTVQDSAGRRQTAFQTVTIAP